MSSSDRGKRATRADDASRSRSQSVWAGHRDAALSHHGFEQSMRLATHFKDVPITGELTSSLLATQDRH
jgi:broad specificity phosphatase PhoE